MDTHNLEVPEFSYDIIDEGSKPEILSRTARTTAALTRLKPVWKDRSVFLSPKIRLMCSLVTSSFLYACESWTLTAESKVNELTSRKASNKYQTTVAST